MQNDKALGFPSLAFSEMEKRSSVIEKDFWTPKLRVQGPISVL